MLTITNIQATTMYTHKSRFNNCNLYMIMVTETSVVGCDENGKYYTYNVAFRVSLLTITPPRLPGVTTLPTPICLCRSLPERPVQTVDTYINAPEGDCLSVVAMETDRRVERGENLCIICSKHLGHCHIFQQTDLTGQSSP